MDSGSPQLVRLAGDQARFLDDFRTCHPLHFSRRARAQPTPRRIEHPKHGLAREPISRSNQNDAWPQNLLAKRYRLAQPHDLRSHDVQQPE